MGMQFNVRWPLLEAFGHVSNKKPEGKRKPCGDHSFYHTIGTSNQAS